MLGYHKKGDAMSIWFTEPSPSGAAEKHRDTLVECLGMEITHVEADAIEGRMPVDERTRNPLGLLHGGASVALAETLGSYASNMCVDPDRYYCVGLEINANHIRSARQGLVHGRAVPVHLGRRTHIWQIDIRDDDARHICTSRITISVIKHREDGA